MEGMCREVALLLEPPPVIREERLLAAPDKVLLRELLPFAAVRSLLVRGEGEAVEEVLPMILWKMFMVRGLWAVLEQSNNVLLPYLSLHFRFFFLLDLHFPLLPRSVKFMLTPKTFPSPST